MKQPEPIGNALALLRKADCDVRASDAAELRVREAYRRHHTRRNGLLAFLMSAAAAVLVLTVLTWRSHTPVPAAPTALPLKASTPLAPERSLTVAAQKQTAQKQTAQKDGAARVSKRPARQKSKPAEPLTAEFLALPFAPPMTEWDRGHVMRVQVPRQSLRRLGLPVNEERLYDRVPAELLVGEDGLARGIRFVTTTNQ